LVRLCVRSFLLKAPPSRQAQQPFAHESAEALGSPPRRTERRNPMTSHSARRRQNGRGEENGCEGLLAAAYTATSKVQKAKVIYRMKAQAHRAVGRHARFGKLTGNLLACNMAWRYLLLAKKMGHPDICSCCVSSEDMDTEQCEKNPGKKMRDAGGHSRGFELAVPGLAVESEHRLVGSAATGSLPRRQPKNK
jgi:hypothetical protein